MASQLRSVDEHLDRILDVIAPLRPYGQPLPEVLGLPLCEDVTSPVELPGFDNSGMDGYAVRAADLDGAGDDTPVRLPVVGTDRGVAEVRIRQAPKVGQHVRHAGEDVRIGDPLLDEGALLGPRQIG